MPPGFFANRLYATSQTYYQILTVSLHASLSDIKLLFRKLLKKYHPDLNSHLSPEEKEENSRKYTEIVLAYDTLKDPRRRREYDSQIGRRSPRSTSAFGGQYRRTGDWHYRAYTENKAYTRRGSANYSASGYNYTRHKVHNFYTREARAGELHFGGRHTNMSDRYDVPHFNYNEHLAKQLKFEQRLIKRGLSAQELDLCLRQLVPDGDVSKVSAELLTKYLMRQRRSSQNSHTSSASAGSYRGHQYMYQRPQGYGTQETRGHGLTTIAVLGAGSMFLLYKCFN